MLRHSTLFTLLLLTATACQSGGTSSFVGGGDPGDPPGAPVPEAPVLSLSQTLDDPPEFFRIFLEAREANILKGATRSSTANLAGGTFVLRRDPDSTGSYLEGYCPGAPAGLGARPANALSLTKVDAVQRVGSLCETVAAPAGAPCGLYIDIQRFHGAAFGGSNVGPFWICNSACADGSKCSPIMDLQGTIACECRATGS